MSSGPVSGCARRRSPSASGARARPCARRSCNSRARGSSRSSRAAARSCARSRAPDLIDLYEVRVLLEPAAAARAALRMRRGSARPPAGARGALGCSRRSRRRRDRRPDRLERGVPRDRDRGRAAALACRLRCAPRRASRAASAARSGATKAHRAFSQTCHRELVSALAEGSAERAEAVMRMHILRAKDALVAVTNGD